MNDVNFQNFGYPKPGDNVRGKPAVIFDSVPFVSGQMEYVLYNSTALGSATRNKALPLSSGEVMFINKISASWLEYDSLFTAQSAADWLMFYYLQVFINDREVLKIPMALIMDIFDESSLFDVSSAEYSAIGYKRTRSHKKFAQPLILNGNDNVVFRISGYGTGIPTYYNGKSLRVTMSGTKYDKLTSFDWDNIKSKQYVKTPYVVYDVNTFADAAQTWRLFTDKTKDLGKRSKVFPLSNDESFVIEAISGHYVSRDETKFPYLIFSELYKNKLNITINGVEFFDGISPDMFNLYEYNTNIAASWGTPDEIALRRSFSDINNFYVLDTPIIVPANAEVVTSLVQPAMQYGDYSFMWCLHGTLIQRVQ